MPPGVCNSGAGFRVVGGRYAVGVDAGYTQMVIVDTVTWQASRSDTLGNAVAGGLVVWHRDEVVGGVFSP